MEILSNQGPRGPLGLDRIEHTDSPAMIDAIVDADSNPGIATDVLHPGLAIALTRRNV